MTPWQAESVCMCVCLSVRVYAYNYMMHKVDKLTMQQVMLGSGGGICIVGGGGCGL